VLTGMPAFFLKGSECENKTVGAEHFKERLHSDGKSQGIEGLIP